MVGGRDYGKSPFNRVTQARRQPGSTFKTIVYLTALEAGWEPDDTIPNTPITQGSYRPKNAAEAYSDQITLEDAFAQSSNVAAVRLLQAVGSERSALNLLLRQEVSYAVVDEARLSLLLREPQFAGLSIVGDIGLPQLLRIGTRRDWPQRPARPSGRC